MNALWAEKQLELVALSTNSFQVIAAESAHYIQYDQPELVVEAIQQMVQFAKPVVLLRESDSRKVRPRLRPWPPG